MTKDELRAFYRQIRLRMSRAEVSTKSRLINKCLIDGLDWDKYRVICLYSPIGNLNEIDTTPLAKKLYSQGNEVVLLGQSKNAGLPAEKFDLIIVPCLAFDKKNFRLGWGGGFYDNFLAGQPRALKIGLCYQNGFISAGIPREPHDLALDKIITEA